MRLDLSPAELAAINRGRCPDCNYIGFHFGPRGGAAVNIECMGCGNRFNVGPLRFLLGERIPRQDQGGSSWENCNAGKESQSD